MLMHLTNVATVHLSRRNEAATSTSYTSSLTVDVHQAVLHAGARDVLVKPFHRRAAGALSG